MNNVLEKIMSREQELKLTIKGKLPKFYEACETDQANAIILHQDAFAADLQPEEYALLGMAVKCAGLFGKEVRVIGKNDETIGVGEKS